MQKLTPMMEQYLEIKKQHPDCILFFRLGDFYEMFFEDALTASKILDITLTGKACGLKERAPMCGVPYHSVEGYIQKLILSGKKVAICEQVEDPASSKGIVRREVIRIVTPGTVLDEEIITRSQNNYLMSIAEAADKKSLDISFMDVSTGDRSTVEVPIEDFSDLFHKVAPAEILLDDSSYELLYQTRFKNSAYILALIKEKNIVLNRVKGSDYSTIKMKPSLRMIYDYIEYTQKSKDILEKQGEELQSHMILDQFTFKNLELTETIRSGKVKGSLLWVIDCTNTPMGARMLKNWVEYPLREKKDIEDRLRLVENFYRNPMLCKESSKLLKEIHDIERICTKLSYETSKHQDILKLKHSLGVLPTLKEWLYSAGLQSQAEGIPDFQSLYQLLEEALEEQEEEHTKSRNIIRSSYHHELSALREIIEHSSDLILQMEQQERELTGIRNLKIGYNKVFGYYIEITKAGLRNVEQLPPDYIRKQTLASSERYINEALKVIEEKILTAKEKSEALEQRLYEEVKGKIRSQIKKLLDLAKKLALIDCYNALAKTALDRGYHRPAINEEGRLRLVDSRHPVVEAMFSEEHFIPNDALIKKGHIHIVTGPNMAGKSTYMRQVALIALMAHIGSFVPCSEADICTIDKIFTRVGASDDLSQGQSTFMVEMSEVSTILKNATPKSLIILDEIGRGTSTYDGMSIAYAVIEYIQEKIRAKALVSTHYHEITSLDEKYKNIENYCMAVDESKENIRFLRKIIPGKSDKSYGIHVAKLAELPQEVIGKAYRILAKLEREHTIKLRDSFGEIDIDAKKESPRQLSFEQGTAEDLLQNLRQMNIDQMTPIEALNVLYEMKNKVG